MVWALECDCIYLLWGQTIPLSALPLPTDSLYLWDLSLPMVPPARSTSMA
jgi:hypothetical protein